MLDAGVSFLQEYGWHLFLLLFAVYFFLYKKSQNSGPSVVRVDESLRRRRIEQLQAEYDVQAVQDQEKRKQRQKEDQEAKMTEKIEEWNRLQGFSEGRRLSEQTSSSSASQEKKKDVKSWRGQYNPLTGSSSSSGYRPSKKKPPGGGCCGSGGGCG